MNSTQDRGAMEILKISLILETGLLLFSLTKQEYSHSFSLISHLFSLAERGKAWLSIIPKNPEMQMQMHSII